MKKHVIISTILGIGIAVSAIIGCMSVLDNYHQEQINAIVSEYEEQLKAKTEEVTALDAQLDSLESEVYNMMNGEDYDITVHHDGETHEYQKTRDGLFFSDVSHTVTKTLQTVFEGEES